MRKLRGKKRLRESYFVADVLSQANEPFNLNVPLSHVTFYAQTPLLLIPLHIFCNVQLVGLIIRIGE